MKSNSSNAKVKADKAYHFGEYIIKVHQLRCLSVMEKHVATLMIGAANSNVGADGRVAKSAIWFQANVSDYSSTQESDVSERTIQRAHRRLETLGIFTVKTRGKNKGTRCTTNVWNFQPCAVDALLDEQNGVVHDDDTDVESEESDDLGNAKWASPMTPTTDTHDTYYRHPCHPLRSRVSPYSGSGSGSLSGSGSEISARGSVADAAPRAAATANDKQHATTMKPTPPPSECTGLRPVTGPEQEEEHADLGAFDVPCFDDADASDYVDADQYNTNPLDELDSYTVGRDADAAPELEHLDEAVVDETARSTTVLKVVSAPITERRPVAAPTPTVGPVNNDWNTWDSSFDDALGDACSRNSRADAQLAKRISYAMEPVQAWYTLEQFANCCTTLSVGLAGIDTRWIHDAAETIALTVDAQGQGYTMITNRVCGLVRRRMNQNAARNA